MTDSYAMPRDAAETGRLRLQAEIMGPHSAHLFKLAGIGPGMRVLDVGCGTGDVSMVLADLVGPTGSVLGVDVDPGVLEVARERAREAGLTNVSYLEADLGELRPAEPVDALAGRLILMHLPDAARTVRELSRQVRPGGVVSFQDYNVSRCRSVPSTPLLARSMRWVIDAMRASGIEPDMGERIVPTLAEAGLDMQGVAAVEPAGTADSLVPEFLAATARSLLPLALAHGVVTEDEVVVDGMAGRVADELRAVRATVWTAELVGAWARVPRLAGPGLAGGGPGRSVSDPWPIGSVSSGGTVPGRRRSS
ncbi:class I SAM-dependent methyltransferase [Amycolatopsis sp. NPDC051061]|uniref:class I SAM-dependent methyltransferase n=1 Tax=Amycolatopsis sp. NPDC051061 TaxID=3155042 RepID=UPI003426DDD7